MKIEQIIKNSNTSWQREKPTQPTAVNELLASANFDLPVDYSTFLSYSNGGEGELDVDPWWFFVWKAEEVLEANQAYEVANYHPGYFGFGSSLGGVMFAFKIGEIPSRIYGVPFDSTDEEDIRIVAESFLAFAQAMH